MNGDFEVCPVGSLNRLAGLDRTEIEMAFERSTGQQQLDDAGSLIREAAEMFRSYEAHHRERAAQDGAVPGATEKAERNALMAERLEAWLRGDGIYPVSPARLSLDGAPTVTTISGAVASSLPTGCESVLDIAEHQSLESSGVMNVRPVTSGPLADPDVVEAMLCAAGLLDGTTGQSVSLATATAFRLQTADPRFDPSRPVCVNGFLYTPATEA